VSIFLIEIVQEIVGLIPYFLDEKREN